MDLYLQVCLERRKTFTPIVYSTDRIPGAESLTAQKRLSALLSYKLKQEYSEMSGLVKARISLAIVRSNSLLLRSPQEKEACILQQPQLAEGGSDRTDCTLVWFDQGAIEGEKVTRGGQGLG